MKTTISKSFFTDNALIRESFSYHGAMALFDWLEEWESDCGKEIDFDPIAIRCDFSETTISDFLAENEIGQEDFTPSQLRNFLENYISEKSFFVGWIDTDTFIYQNF